MSTGRDWAAWHEAYDNPDTALAHRLRAVQARITEALDQAQPGPVHAISICAGQGRDLIGVLREHPRRRDVTARLVELDPRNAAAARQRATDAGLIPASLVLACGVFGNITDEDVARTIRCCTGLCAPGGTVVWTRGRGEPDLVPQIRDWFAAEGFALVGVSEPVGVPEPGRRWAVGAHRFEGQSKPLPDQKMFTFVGRDVLRADHDRA